MLPINSFRVQFITPSKGLAQKSEILKRKDFSQRTQKMNDDFTLCDPCTPFANLAVKKTFETLPDGSGCLDEIKSAKVALEGGCRWIQLRMKDASLEEVERVALQLKPLCKSYNAVFLLNDHVELCKKIGADGVHLGKTDMNPHEARQLLGNDFIIGSTCNTFEDIENLKDTQIDYIGLGPFRFTETKQNLSPILGLEGYKNIVSQCKKSNINIPIVAIGGITADDVVPILQTGIEGIALSSAILRAEDPVREMDKMIKAFGDKRDKIDKKIWINY